MREKLILSFVILVTTGVLIAQDRTLQHTSQDLPSAVRAEAKAHIERAYALLRNHQFDVALREAQEALRLDPYNSAASNLAALLSPPPRSRCSDSIKSHCNEDARGEDLNQRDIVLRTDQPILLRLLQPVTSSPSIKDALGVQVVHDVTVNGTIVIQKQTPIKYSVERQPAGDLTEPGVLTVLFESVTSVSGDEIRLVGSESGVGSGGKPTCVAEDCMLIPLVEAYAHVRKGHEATLRQGLLTAAYVKSDYVMPAAKMPQPSSTILLPTETGSSRGARIHFYYNDTQPVPIQFPSSAAVLQEALPVRVDNIKMGVLPIWHYACTTAMPGVHDVKIGKASLRLLVKAEQEYFVKVEATSAGVTVDRTEDYTIDARPLLPSSFKKKYSMNCWD